MHPLGSLQPLGIGTWRLGEDAIRYWHNLTDGVRGRKEIDDEFLRNHKNHE